jgi:N-acetylglucosaminyldiphosphoundecaprenol N-acetyl-beta-D-mannosaminyltransferase
MRFGDRNIEKENPGRTLVAILGVPFDKVTIGEAVTAIEEMVASRQPHYLVTANVDFLVQAQQDGELRRILANADLSLCDGTPVVWASRLLGSPLPERVAGSDLTPLLLKVAAEKGLRVYFLGATPEALAEAVARLERELPSLIIAGHESPPFRPLSNAEDEEIARRIQEARPDLVFVAFGCPKAEKWIARHYQAIGAPVMVGVGATIDFLAGRVKRAPRWMARSGVEWIYRLIQEPRRLWRRYTRDLWVFGWSIVAQWLTLSHSVAAELQSATRCAEEHGVLDLSNVSRIDSAGVGLLLALQKKLRAEGRQLVLASPNRRVRRALAVMRLQDDFIIAPDLAAAHRLASPVSPIWMTKRAA